MDVSKNRATPKWMVYNGSKPYEQMDDLGGKNPLFLVQQYIYIRIYIYIIYVSMIISFNVDSSPNGGCASTPPRPGYRSCSGGLQTLQRPGKKSRHGCFFVVFLFFFPYGSMGLLYKPYIWLVLMVKYMVNV